MADPTKYARRPFGDATSDEYTQAMDAKIALDALQSEGMPAPGDSLAPTAVQTPPSVAFDPGTPASALPAEQEPSLEPSTPRLSIEAAVDLAAMDDAQKRQSMYTPAALKAQREMKLLGNDNEKLLHQQGDRAQTLGINQEAQHLEIANEVRKHGDAIKELNDAAAAAEEQNQKDIEARHKAIEDSRKATIEASDKLDPARLLGPAGNRIMFVIAASLGALGQSFIGGRNNAVDMVNNILDNDFEGQKARLKGRWDNLSAMEQQLQDLRSKGVDERAARAAVKSSLNEIMGNLVDQMKERGLSAESRAAGENLRDQFYMQANQWRIQSLTAAAKQRTAAPKTKQELLREALTTQKLQNEVRAQEIAANKNMNPKSDEKPADLERQTKLADKVSNADLALTKIDELIGMVESGKVGVWNANAPATVRSAAGDKFNDIRNNIEDLTARGYGGPRTESDSKIAHERWGAFRLTDAGVLEHLKNMREITKADRDALFSGKPREDVNAVQRNLNPPKKTVADIQAALKPKQTR